MGVWSPFLLGPIAIAVVFIALAFLWRHFSKRQDARRKARVVSRLHVTESQRSTHSAMHDVSSIGDDQRGDVRGLHAKENTFDLSFHELGLELLQAPYKRVLHGVTGEILHGELTAVMGPSGSGKTTFLSSLSGRAHYGRLLGTIRINGKRDSLSKYPKLVGFVPQEDIMIRSLTVEETLEFSARTRLPARFTTAQRKAVVEDVIDLLGLTEVCHSRIGDENVRGISGGQRKRVNLGIELVADPTVLFLDEPTSGLDSTSSMELCGALRRLKRFGLTTVAVIHQPRYEIFHMFDTVLLLGKGGRTVYLGPTDQCLAYFEDMGFQCPEHVNPADFVLDVIGGDVQCPSNPNFDPASLFDVWKERGPAIAEQRRQSHFQRTGKRVRLGMSAADSPLPHRGPLAMEEEDQDYGGCEVKSVDERAHLFSASSTSLQRELSSVHMVEEDLLDGQLEVPGHQWGSMRHFWLMFALCAVAPVALPWAVNHKPGGNISMRYKYGGIISATLFAGMFLTPISFVFLTQVQFHGLLRLTGAIMLIMVVFLLGLSVYAVRRYMRRRDPVFIGNFVCGMMLGPLYIYPQYSNSKATPSARYASICGFGFFVLWLGLLLMSINVGGPFAMYGYISLIPTTGAAMLVAFAHRWRSLPTKDRRTVGFRAQMWMFIRRSFIEQTRNWKAIIFDLSLPIFSGLFLGVIYYERRFEVPLAQVLGLKTCPSTWPVIMCGFLEMPQDDPIPGEATLTTMSLALSGVASALRVFGAEKSSAKREASSGLSSEAHYMGRSVAHLPLLFLAPLCFLLSYSAFARPVGNFAQLYFLFFLVYYTTSGLGYLISILFPEAVAQLIGVLSILGFMMFSGSSPTLQQLKSNALLGEVLYYPTAVSLFRWTQELFYLIEIKPVVASLATSDSLNNWYTFLYDYHMSDWTTCWLMIGVISYYFRLAAYVAFVVKTES